jgi:hypothetical protein
MERRSQINTRSRHDCELRRHTQKITLRQRAPVAPTKQGFDGRGPCVFTNVDREKTLFPQRALRHLDIGRGNVAGLDIASLRFGCVDELH